LFRPIHIPAGVPLNNLLSLRTKMVCVLSHLILLPPSFLTMSPPFLHLHFSNSHPNRGHLNNQQCKTAHCSIWTVQQGSNFYVLLWFCLSVVRHISWRCCLFLCKIFPRPTKIGEIDQQYLQQNWYIWH
jgi:hypothetical protein